MKTLEQIREALRPMRLTDVADATGVSYGAVWRLMQPGSKPSYQTVKAITDWLESRQ